MATWVKLQNDRAINLDLVREAKPAKGGIRVYFDSNHSVLIPTSEATPITKATRVKPGPEPATTPQSKRALRNRSEPLK